MLFTREKLKEMDLPWSAKEDRITDVSRWSIHHEIIFEYEGKHYRTSYAVGATEQQEERPWEYQSQVECTEVWPVEKKVMVWEPVKYE